VPEAAAIRPEEPSLEDFFENGALALHIVGPDGAILRANRAELEMLGYSADEYVGRNIGDFHADEASIADILTRLTCGETLDKHPARLRAKDGSIRHVLISSSVCFDSQGRFLNTRCFTIDVTEQRRLEEARDLLVAELNHRVMNTLSVVHALARQSFTGAGEPAGPQVAFLERLRALSAIHKLLGRNDWAFANLQCALEIALAPYPREQWSLSGPVVSLAPAVAVDLALVFNELSANAAKHGALGFVGGELAVEWRTSDCDPHRVELSWRERGGEVLAEEPRHVGFGTRLLDQVVSRQLLGRSSVEYRADGLDAELEFVTRR
jgi:PAS domain S-box-containing protein